MSDILPAITLLGIAATAVMFVLIVLGSLGR